MEIRKATIEDFPKLAPIQAAWLKDQHTVYPLDIPLSIQWLKTLLTRDDGVCYVAWDGENAVGWICGELSEYTFTRDRVVKEMAWFVLPGSRGCGSGLMEALARWGKTHGARKLITTALLSAGSDNGERACGALKKLGFIEFERTFYSEL